MKFFLKLVLAYISCEIVLTVDDLQREKRQLFYSDIQDKPKSFRPRASEKESAGSAPEEEDSALFPQFTSAGVVPSFSRRPTSKLKDSAKPTLNSDESYINNPTFDIAPQKPKPSYQSLSNEPSYQIHNPLSSFDEPEPYRPRPVHDEPGLPYESLHKRPQPEYEESIKPKPIHSQSGPSYVNPHRRPKPATKPDKPSRLKSRYPTSIRKVKRPVFGQRRKPVREQPTADRQHHRRPQPSSEQAKPTAFINQSNSPKLSVRKRPLKKRPTQQLLKPNPAPYAPNSDISEFGEQPIPKATINFQNPKIFEEIQHVPSRPSLSYNPKSSSRIHGNTKPSYANEDPHLGLTSSAVYEQDSVPVNHIKGDPGYQAPHSYRGPQKPKPAYEEPYNERRTSQNRDHLIPKASSYKPKTSGDHSQKLNRLSYKEKKNPIPGVAGKDYPIYNQVPHTSFSCNDVPARPGMYANLETGCQAYHVCHDDRHGHQGASFLCTNGTIFNQETFSCDWWYNVDCSKAESFYGLNSDPKFNPYYKKPYEEEEKYKHAASNIQKKPFFSSYNQPQPSYIHHSAPTAATLLSQGTTTNTFFLPRPANTPLRITRPLNNARATKVRQIIRKALPSSIPHEKNYEFRQNFQTIKSFLRRFQDESESTNMKGNDERVVVAQPQQTSTDFDSETLKTLKRIMRRRKHPNQPEKEVLSVVAPQNIPEMLVEEIPEGAVVDLEWGQRSP